MTVRDRRRELALRRILEGVIATVAGGLILWSVTNSMSQPAPQARIIAAAPAVESRAAPAPASPAAEEPMPRAAARVPVPAFIPAPTAELPPPKCSLLPYFAPLPAGPVLLYEDFSDCREGETPGWGPNTFIKTGLDRRHWLVSNVEGPHPVGCRIPLPDRFSFQCRYSAYLPELTRGILYWWKEPVATKVSFLNDQGARWGIEWVIRCGNDPTRLNPLGSPSVFAKKYYHAVKLPDGTSNEIAVAQPTGILQVDVDHSTLKVSFDGEAAAAGTAPPLGRLAGFEINVIKAANGMLFFTDFKISR